MSTMTQSVKRLKEERWRRCQEEVDKNRWRGYIGLIKEWSECCEKGTDNVLTEEELSRRKRRYCMGGTMYKVLF